MDHKQYQELMDYLLQLDFSDYSVSHESTKGWISKAAELNGRMNEPWGVEIKGTGQVGKEVFSKKRKASELEDTLPLKKGGTKKDDVKKIAATHVVFVFHTAEIEGMSKRAFPNPVLVHLWRHGGLQLLPGRQYLPTRQCSHSST